VTVIDDGTLPDRRGSLTIDDEGTPTEKTVLIEDGILKGYMQDYNRGGNLTDKRRHILNSGESLMDSNDEFRMRMDIPWAKRHRPKSERNQNYADYISKAIAYAEDNLDPNLVEQVRSAGVANPAKKFERVMDSNRKDVQAMRGLLDKKALMSKPEINPDSLGGWSTFDGNKYWVNSSEYPSKEVAATVPNVRKNYLYENLNGEVMSNLAMERADIPNSMLAQNNPFDSREFSKYPPQQQTVWYDDKQVTPELNPWLKYAEKDTIDSLLSEIEKISAKASKRLKRGSK